jgi:hypothetical protein
MPDLLITISAVIGLLTLAHLINKGTWMLSWRLKFREFPKKEGELKIEYLEQENSFLKEENIKLQAENDSLSKALIKTIE